MHVEMRGVIPHHARKPKVHADVDGQTVLWDPYRGGWRCWACGPGVARCKHIEAVIALLHPDVIGRVGSAPALSCHSCSRVIGQRAIHRLFDQTVLCIPCAERPGAHADLLPDCPDVYNHPSTNTTRAVAARQLGMCS